MTLFLETLAVLEHRVDKMIGSSMGDKISNGYKLMQDSLNLVQIPSALEIAFEDCNGFDSLDQKKNVHQKLSKINYVYPIVRTISEDIPQTFELKGFTHHSGQIFYNPTFIVHITGSSVFGLYSNKFAGNESSTKSKDLLAGAEVPNKNEKARSIGIDGALLLLSTKLNQNQEEKNNSVIILKDYFKGLENAKFSSFGSKLYYNRDIHEFTNARNKFNKYLASFEEIINMSEKIPPPSN